MQLHPAFKPLVAAVVGGWLAMGAATAFAQMTPQTADMTVTGTIVPAACSASFAGGGEVDFDTIRLIDLPANAFHSLGTRDTSLTVSCNANKTIYFGITDLQATTAVREAAMVALLPSLTDPYLYGLGTAMVAGAPVNLGAYTVGFSHASSTVDGTARTVLYRTSATGGVWTALGSTNTYWPQNSGGTVGTFTVGSGSTASSGRTFVFPLRIAAALNYGSRLQVAEDTRFNGQAVFAISYQ